jgi:hypothetical protein
LVAWDALTRFISGEFLIRIKKSNTRRENTAPATAAVKPGIRSGVRPLSPLPFGLRLNLERQGGTRQIGTSRHPHSLRLRKSGVRDRILNTDQAFQHDIQAYEASRHDERAGPTERTTARHRHRFCPDLEKGASDRPRAARDGDPLNRVGGCAKAIKS